MADELFEIRVVRSGQEVRDTRFVTPLDLRDVPGLRDLLNRHALAVCDRAQVARELAHLFVLEVYRARDGQGYGSPAYRWALPVALEVPR